MAIKVSTGLRSFVSVSGSLKQALDGGCMVFYEGTEPSTANAGVGSAEAVWTVTVDGDGSTGLTFGNDAGSGSLLKTPSENWCGPTSAGTPNFWRFYGDMDDDGSSNDPDLVRIQGKCGISPTSDIYMTNPVLVDNSDADAKVLDAFSVAVIGLGG